MTDTQYQLLGTGDPAPVEQFNTDGDSIFVLTCEHAGKTFPRKLGTLGLAAADIERHITYDIGAEGVARRLSEELHAPLILQRYSRLVVDCNRAPGADDFITTCSESTSIPGNRSLPQVEIDARNKEIFAPYHDCIGALLDDREIARRPTILVAVHTCTPVFHGVSRPWHIGVLYDRDDRFAQAMLDLLTRYDALTIGENEPYELTHERDYAVPVHGELRNLLHVEFEIRQDLVESEAGQAQWSRLLRETLVEGAAAMREYGYV